MNVKKNTTNFIRKIIEGYHSIAQDYRFFNNKRHSQEE